MTICPDCKQNVKLVGEGRFAQHHTHIGACPGSGKWWWPPKGVHKITDADRAEERANGTSLNEIGF